MILAAVGTGTCVPRLDRGGPCVLVQAGGTAVALDLGLGALRGILARGVRHADLDAVCLTHLHPDHTAELAALLFAANYDEQPRSRPLVVAGGAGVDRHLRGLAEAHGRWVEPGGYELRVLELGPGDAFEVGAVGVRVGAVRHTEASLAYRLESGGRCAVVSGDTGPCPELEGFAAGADLLVLEASLAEGAAYEGHLTARQAGELARRAGVGRLVLTHFYPASEAGDPASRAAAAFGGRVWAARDGMAWEV